MLLTILTTDMQRMMAEQKLGLVATVDADGTPNLSPKATFVVVGEDCIVFGDLRSPNTKRNVAERPGMEISFVDPIARKGFRAKGQAKYIAKDDGEFANLIGNFKHLGALSGRFRGLFVLQVERAVMVMSPAYDDGAVERELRTSWLAHFNAINADVAP